MSACRYRCMELCCKNVDWITHSHMFFSHCQWNLKKQFSQVNLSTEWYWHFLPWECVYYMKCVYILYCSSIAFFNAPTYIRGYFIVSMTVWLTCYFLIYLMTIQLLRPYLYNFKLTFSTLENKLLFISCSINFLC